MVVAMRFLRKILKAVLIVDALAVTGALILKFTVTSEGGPSANRFRLMAIFDGAELRSTAKELENGVVVAMFGGAQVDLRRADTGAANLTLDVTAVFGGVEIIVPDSWAVTQLGRAIAAGVDLRVPAVETLPNDAPRLTIQSRALFAGVSVVARPVLRTAEG
jgi:hypothetical protein